MRKEIFIDKRTKLMELVEDKSIVLLFAGREPYKSADEVYNFTPNRNFYYLTGINRQNMILMMYKRNGQVHQSLFIEKNDPQLARWIGEKMSINEANEISGIEDIQYLDKFYDVLGFLFERYEYNNLYLDLERAEWDIPMTKAQEFAKYAKEKYPFLNIRNIYHNICKMRLVKSKEEIDNIREAIRITEEGIYNTMRNMKPGMMEYQVEAYFDFVLISNGVTDKAFKTIAASGKNAATLHYSDNNCKTKDRELIQFDLGAQYKYYNGDISRAIPLNGKFTERQKQVYNVVLRANKNVIEMTKPGVSFAELEAKTREILAQGCIELGLMKDPSELSKYYFHSVGHHLGLDTHDVGGKDDRLKPGMVFTDEPGLYIPEEGIGIRIEDDLLVTEDGCEVLTKNMIKEISEIEDYMAKNNNNLK
ncbi:aminopeptidase P family protein [Haloimpatiens sp. FM7330]|uniref:aminopeptidase P family protein n=1 Tax=Haloimpatiens sp. FM7330 TaxID=3298610 RepID=UPI0036450972